MAGAPGLRERVIDAICAEWPNEDNELHITTIYERLKSAGDNATQDEVQQVLKHLAEHNDIQLTFAQSRGTGPVVANVRQGLCS